MQRGEQTDLIGRGRPVASWRLDIETPPERTGVALLALAAGGGVATHLLGSWLSTTRPGLAMFLTGAVVIAVLGATVVGADLVVDAARATRHHVFCFGALRRAAVILLFVAAAHSALPLSSGFFADVWRSGSIGAREIASIGSLGIALTCWTFAAFATRLAWRAYHDERWV